MQQTPYHHLAKEFMELWQKQVASVVNDKQFIQAMLDMFNSTSHTTSHAFKHDTTAANTATSTDANHGMLAELAFRLAMCEKRLSQLEQRGGKSGAKPRIKSGATRRSARTSGKGRSKKSSK